MTKFLTDDFSRPDGAGEVTIPPEEMTSTMLVSQVEDGDPEAAAFFFSKSPDELKAHYAQLAKGKQGGQS